MSGDVVQVVVTVPSAEEADRIGAGLVGAGSVACAQVSGPIRSTYRWEGAVERAEEWVLTLKTTGLRVPDVVAAVKAGHPYDVPEVLVVPVLGGDRDYLDWVRDSCR